MEGPTNSISDVFGEIYANRSWGEGASLSGTGSDPNIAAPYVDFTLDYVDRQRVSSIVDIGHGDWRMWPSTAFEGTNYSGFDVAHGLSLEVSNRCGQPDRTFQHADARLAELPIADLALCKDVLQHLSNADVKLVLNNLQKYPAIIISHDVTLEPAGKAQRFRFMLNSISLRQRLAHIKKGKSPFGKMAPHQNVDIPTGGYRLLDLAASPWGFAKHGFEVIEALDYATGVNPRFGVVKRIWLIRPISQIRVTPSQ